jgi:hypothetical protein
MARMMTEAPPPDSGPIARKAAPAGKRKKASETTRAPSKPERPRGGEARRVADLVPAIGDMAFRKFGFVQSSIITRWPDIVGPKLARVTSPESLRFPQGKKADGTLSITVGSAHATVVQHVVPDIIERVNRFFGYAAVSRIRLNQGGVRRPSPAVRLPLADPAATPPTVPISPTLNGIADPELRAVLEGLASSLARRDALPKIS